MDYAEREYLVVGRAGTYSGSAAGVVTRTDAEVDYVTRILVRSPHEAERFSGRVLVEPFNTSNGADTDALWSRVASLLTAQGDAWVGVSERVSSQRALQKHDAARYEQVQIPSNDIAWDILAQVASLVRDPMDGPLAGLPVRHTYLGGYSQSGADTATFAMAIHPQTRSDDGLSAFDGYFPAAHSGSITSLVSGTAQLPSFESVPMVPVDVPVVDVETQTDVEGLAITLPDGRPYTAAGGAHVRRQDADEQHDRYRLWEVAGAPHAAYRPGCEGGGSRFPTDAFLRAGLAMLFRWTETGAAPPRGPRIELESLDIVSAVRLDEYGNAVGGVRSPLVEVPLARYEAHAGSTPLCCLIGRETTLSGEQLRARYGGDLSNYLREMTASLDATVGAGFLLAADRDALHAELVVKAGDVFATELG